MPAAGQNNYEVRPVPPRRTIKKAGFRPAGGLSSPKKRRRPMNEKWNDVRVRTLRPEEVENLLAREFGDKVNPVDAGELAKRHRMAERKQP